MKVKFRKYAVWQSNQHERENIPIETCEYK